MKNDTTAQLTADGILLLDGIEAEYCGAQCHCGLPLVRKPGHKDPFICRSLFTGEERQVTAPQKAHVNGFIRPN